MTTTTPIRMAQRSDTTANWTDTDPVLLEGELTYDSDEQRVKMGDGVTPWSELPYWNLTLADVSPAVADAITGPGPAKTALDTTYVNTISPVAAAYGGVGDDTAADQAALTAALTAGVSFGLTVDGRGLTYNVTDTFTVPAGAVLQNAVIHGTGTGKRACTIGGDNVTLRDVSFIGRHATATYSTEEYGIYSHGASAAAPLRNVRLERVSIELFGKYGVHMRYVDGFEILDCDIGDLGYGGLFLQSVLNGYVLGNRVENVLSGLSGNGYGITLGREQTDSLVTDPMCENVMVANNHVRDVPWNGIDQHGGINNTFDNNHVYHCGIGIASGSADNASNVATFAPQGAKVTNNTIISEVTDGSLGAGVSFAGAPGTVGAPVQTATGMVTGNYIKGHGDQSNAINGAIYMRDTSGVAVTGNTIIEPSPHAIVLYHDNYGISVLGNTVVDQWSETVATCAVVIVPSGYLTGVMSGNVHRDAGGKSGAAHHNARGYSGSATAVTLEMGLNYLAETAAPVLTATGVTQTFRVDATFTARALFADGTVALPSVSFSSDPNSGLYSVANDQLGVSVGGTRRVLFTTSSLSLTDGINLVVGSTTGTLIGSSASQKLGFWGKTPIVQPTGTPAAATDLATVITLANSLRTNLIAAGVVAT